jgi:hypothetical protein
MERVTGVDYTAPDGSTISTRYDSGVWIITDSTGRHEFGNVRAWIDYISETYGWPLPSVVID